MTSKDGRMRLLVLTKQVLGNTLPGIVAAAAFRGLVNFSRQKAFASIANRETGEQRRAIAPPSADLTQYYEGSFDVEAAKWKKLRNQRGFFTLRDGRNIFFSTYLPESAKIQAVVVVWHGFGDHCDFGNSVVCKALCGVANVGVITFDQPGHGRSDGDFAYVPDWWEFVDASREVLVNHIRPMIHSWPENDLKVFGFGTSLGGGVLFSLLAREPDLLDGAVFVAPMFYVSDELKPPWLVREVFKRMVVPVLPSWPITPSKDIPERAWSDPTRMEKIINAPVHKEITNKAKPKLATAYSFVFVASSWMRAALSDFDTPCLIMHGGADVVTDPKVSQELFQKARCKDKELHLLEGLCHVDVLQGGPLLYDENKANFEKIARWIEDRS